MKLHVHYKIRDTDGLVTEHSGAFEVVAEEGLITDEVLDQVERAIRYGKGWVREVILCWFHLLATPKPRGEPEMSTAVDAKE